MIWARQTDRLRTRLPAGARDFSEQTFLLLVTLGILNGSNYAFHIVVSRMLGPGSYGALAALLAVLLVLSVPFGVLQTVAARRTAALRAQEREDQVARLSAGALKTLVPVAVLGALITLVVLAPALALFLHVDFFSASLLTPYVFLSMLVSVPLGVLQGELRFRAIAAVLLAGVALRLVLGIGAVAAGLGLRGAVLATALAPAATLLPAVRLLGIDRAAWRAARRTVDHFRGGLRMTLVALGSFWLLAEVDIALARHYLAAEEAGYYSSAGLLARSLLFLPAAVAVVAFPRFVAARERGEGQQHWLRLAVASVAVLGLVALPGFILLREPLVSLAFGEQFLAGAELVPLLSLAMALLAVVGVLVYFHIAMGSRAHYLVVGGVVAEGVLVAAFHASGEQIALIVTAVSAAVALTMYATAASLVRWRPLLDRLNVPDEASISGLAGAPTVQLSLVLPCHNVGPGLRQVLKALIRECEHVTSYEIIVVSDGSTDETVAIAEDFSSQAVRVFHYPERGGKGYALHVGLTDARGEYVAFFDADGDIGPEAIRSFLALMELYEPDVVLGSKRHPLSEVYYPPLRRLLSWTYHKIARVLFRVNVRDTQTGLKLIRRDVLVAVLPRLLEKRYAFDLEFLVVARSLGYRRVLEAPVQIEYKFTSTVNPRAAFRAVLDTLAIFYRHYILNTYRQADVGRDPAPFTPGAPIPVVADGLPAPPSRPRLTARRRAGHRILFLNWRDLQNPDAGGAEIFTHEVARRWVEDGHEVSLLTSRFAGAPSGETVDGVRIRRVGKLRNGSFHLAAQRELMRLRGFDLVIDGVNTIPFLTPLWQRRLPTTVALVYQLARDVWEFELPRPLASVGRWVEPRLLQPYRDFPVVTISESSSRDLRELGFENVVVIPPGRDEPPDLHGVGKEAEPTFIFAGRLTANKRPDHAVRAFVSIREVLPNARLWIVGRGPLEAELARTLPDGASLLGYLERDDLYERMARAHCLLLPSVREGWGLVVIEANSVGTPAVGYDVHGVRDSIRDGETGLLADAGDPASLARQALALVVDEAGYAHAQRAAIEWADRFSWDATASALLEFAKRGRPSASESLPVGAATAQTPS